MVTGGGELTTVEEKGLGVGTKPFFF